MRVGDVTSVIIQRIASKMNPHVRHNVVACPYSSQRGADQTDVGGLIPTV